MSRPAVEVRDYQAGDAFILAAQLRDQDRAELIASGWHNHYDAVLTSVKRSEITLTATIDDRLVCIFGLARGGTALAPFGVPWMLGTDRVATHRRALALLAPRYIAAMLRVYPTLCNMVHAENTVAVNWLRRVGFNLHTPIPHPTTGEPFILFDIHV